MYRLHRLYRQFRQVLRGIIEVSFNFGEIDWSRACQKMGYRRVRSTQRTLATLTRRCILPPSGKAYHWNTNAETYYLIGKAMGEAMKKMIVK